MTPRGKKEGRKDLKKKKKKTTTVWSCLKSLSKNFKA